VACGTPEAVAAVKASYTGKALKPVLHRSKKKKASAVKA
jgi:excinuclease UvrABC ATPase subunit